MRPKAGGLSGESADANAGYPRPAGSGHTKTEDEKDQEAQRQPAAAGSEDGTEAHLRSGSDLDRRNRCDDGADDCFGDRNRRESISGRDPLCFVAGVDSRQGRQRRKDHWTREEESEKPCGGNLAHRSHHSTEERHLSGSARYRSLRRKLPSFAAAVKAMGRYLAVLIYRLLTKGEAWVDRGVAQFEQRHTEQELASLNFKARAKGFKLIPITEAN